MALYPYIRAGQSSRHISHPEFDILKASHKFLRDDEDSKDLQWNEQLAAKYYDNLYREFAVCDLKHYKTGNFALRWRTESEVLSGAGETSCGNTRCEHHAAPEGSGPRLTTLELPFAYEEHREAKSALVKVVLCPKCRKKLLWKRQKEKEKQEGEGTSSKSEAGRGDADHERKRRREEEGVEDRRSRQGEKGLSERKKVRRELRP
ncbi:hypothetical protein BDN71DRAFT_1401318 [Pleurotus eryngii]|uniref:Protein FRA10AC1 n=1 Tax=Pleurotus eryngii TaxID=5323 RepID=A0A9P6DAE9_PLEER|nr:hypothetical protein BDN71DRAFT_1401318 [Pleurotus eryngii]